MKNKFKNKILLITGGTGSFGNALLKRLKNDKDFKEIRIFSRDEKKQDDMRRRYKSERIKFFIGDVRNPDSLYDAISGAHYIFHAAALKQVPSCEFYPMEAVQTNIQGTNNVLKIAVRCKVKSLVILSTDKAAYPINAMGISKAMMEKVAVASSRLGSKQGTVVSCTRYGNVMASRGSVIPHFLRQIQDGEPLTITDPKMTRFMMSLDDAVDLVLYSFENAKPGDLFVQKAPAVTIEVLAESLKELMGAQNPLKIIGTRHGEKLYETLLTREERARSVDLGEYFRIPADNRDLNYDQFFSEGNSVIEATDDYHSHNTQRLELSDMKKLLLKIAVVQRALKGESIEE
ncbi:polysaccharide biosynthesis protein [Verrucomicrobia bacterium]|nr:polysaccharide biosynthesis protein [Verrucomicrobiota bacterium]